MGKHTIDPQISAEHLAGAVRFATVSNADHSLTDYTKFDAFHEYLKETYPLVHKHLTLEHTDQAGLLYHWKGTGKSGAAPLLLMAHQDVVPEGDLEKWTYPPYSGTIADGKISIKECPLSMGNREDPARLVFTAKEGHGIATSLIDLGDRFRLIINDVDCKKVEKPMPKLPVGSAFWTPQPDLATGAEAWILAGGAHHTAFSYDLTAEQMGDWAAAMGIEAVYIDKDTTIRNFKNELRWNEVAFRK